MMNSLLREVTTGYDVKSLLGENTSVLDTIADQNKAIYGVGGINCCELEDVTENKGTQSK